MTEGKPSSPALEAGSVQAEIELLKRDRILDAITKIAGPKAIGFSTLPRADFLFP